MFEQIRKRDGKLEKFHPEKITRAIWKAVTACGGEDFKRCQELTDQVIDRLEAAHQDRDLIPGVEEIQDAIEKVLIENKHSKTAKAFILYREKQGQRRNHNALIGGITHLFKQYLEDDNWRIKENANSQWSLAGLNQFLRENFSEGYWLNEIYPIEIQKAHETGDAHVHDLGILASYCGGWDAQQVLLDGFRGPMGKASSRPAKHLGTFLGQLVNWTFTLSGEMAGAQAWGSIDTYCAPFIRKDNMTYAQVKQAVQTFVCELNVSTRVGGQCPFSNLTFDLICPRTLADKPVIIGGVPQEETYSEFQAEMDMFNKAFCEVMLEGDADGRVYTFPIPTINVGKDFDWNAPSVESFMEVTAKYGIPYFANYMNSDLSPEDAVSMCPLTPDTRVIVRSEQNGIRIATIGDIVNGIEQKGTRYEVWTPTGWHFGLPVKVPATDVYQITLSNGAVVKMGQNHLQPIMGGEVKKAESLAIGEWLPFNKAEFGTNLGDYELGYAVGAYLGDGSQSDNSIVYSLCAGEKDDETEQKLRAFWETRMGFKVVTTPCERNVRFVRVNGNSASVINYWVNNGTALEKKLNRSVWNTGHDFRTGLLAGFVATDGARDRKRLYTSSEDLRDDLCTVLVSLGKKYMAHYVDEREGRLGTNPNYRIDYPERTNYGEYFKEDEQYHYFKIESIEKVDYSGDYLYCFEIDNEDHLFTLANGLVTHNCRLRLDLTEMRKRGGGLFGSNPLTGSIGVFTINLPRIGYLSRSVEEFKHRLWTLMHIGKNQLEIKRKVIEQFTDSGLYPYAAFLLRNIKARHGHYWVNHFNTIGVVGMNEAIQNFMGEDQNLTTTQGQIFAREIMKFMQDELMEIQKETGHFYNLEATPAEGTSYRLARLDRERYLDITTAGTKEAPYYTNSTQLPVGFTEDIFETLDLQDELQSTYTGGTVLHLYLGQSVEDPNAVKSLLKTIFTKYKLPYISFTPTFSVCENHGYIRGEHFECPECGAETEVWSRVTGYLRPVQNYNKGKRQEYRDRIKYQFPELAQV